MATQKVQEPVRSGQRKVEPLRAKADLQTIDGYVQQLVASPENMKGMLLADLQSTVQSLATEITRLQDLRNILETEIGERHTRVGRIKNAARMSPEDIDAMTNSPAVREALTLKKEDVGILKAEDVVK